MGVFDNPLLHFDVQPETFKHSESTLRLQECKKYYCRLLNAIKLRNSNTFRLPRLLSIMLTQGLGSLEQTESALSFLFRPQTRYESGDPVLQKFS